MLALRPEFLPIMGSRKAVNAQNDSIGTFFRSLFHSTGRMHFGEMPGRDHAVSVQEIVPVKRIAFDGAEAGVLNHAAELLLAGGASDARGTHHVFLDQD